MRENTDQNNFEYVHFLRSDPYGNFPKKIPKKEDQTNIFSLKYPKNNCCA